MQDFFQLFELSLPAEEKQGDCAGAGVGADDRADVVDDHRFPDAEAPLDLPSYKLGILQRIAVADENRLLFRGDCKLLHAVHQGG